MLDHVVSACNLDSSLRQLMYDQVPTGLWLYDLVWRKIEGSLSAYLGFEGLDQRCSVNLIMRRILN